LDHASLLRPIDHSRNVVRMLAATLVPEHCSSGHCGKLWGRPAVTSRERPRTLGLKGTYLKLPETDMNLIFLDHGCLDKDTNSNEAIAVSRITLDDQIGLLEPG
jgi:hypothetical protein